MQNIIRVALTFVFLIPIVAFGDEPIPDNFEQYNQEVVGDRPNVVRLELFGRANYFSVDYERAIANRVSVGVGIANWRSRSWWDNYTANITVVPVYANYYFSQTAGRAFASLGIDLISVSRPGYSGNTFANNGVAATAGGGYEYRTHAGVVVQLGGFLVVGRSVSISPTLSAGYAF